ncbi:MAG: MerR family transcriptional regulator [Candidatus Pristimantibacillus lignocellulolyticus]|uniref:MerR family transcriptional regulator n=1 Tax=Candidatus Pristimantibacillus lignocellulolyticus TaxID=2994561 RepID=A0A9J6ZKD6_9BACL|nr:MAG: MerR family transcriptional regulator [Candidatus Pristimantibacillus lignocellulolyticus]
MNYWTTGQVSKQHHVSVRTLRYYDQIGLLQPSYKNEIGRRFYSEEDLFTLEKITVLKSLSLSLEDIQSVLLNFSYREILVAHYNHLQVQLADLQQSIANTTSLINIADIEGELSWQHISHLVEKSKDREHRWTDYFSKDENIILEKTLPSIEQNSLQIQQYIRLIKQIEKYMALGIPPESKEGHAIAEELVMMSDETFGGDQELIEKFWEIRKKPTEETGLYPVSPDVIDFVERCIVNWTELHQP